jgi:hypothetical protein
MDKQQMNIERTVGGFSFISNPNVRVLSFTAENKDNKLTGGFTTVVSKEINTISRPIALGVTKAVSSAWFRGRFNRELYDNLMEYKNR